MHDLGPAAREMTRLVNGVRDDQLGDPTPCPKYALGDLLQHVRGLAEAFTVAGRKEQPAGGSKPRTTRGEPATGQPAGAGRLGAAAARAATAQTVNKASRSKPPPEGDTSLLPDNWRAETADWLERLVETWSDPAAWEGTAWIAGFEAPASAVGITAANELVVHGWDVGSPPRERRGGDEPAHTPAPGVGARARRRGARAVQGVRRDDVRSRLGGGTRRRVRSGAAGAGRRLGSGGRRRGQRP